MRGPASLVESVACVMVVTLLAGVLALNLLPTLRAIQQAGERARTSAEIVRLDLILLERCPTAECEIAQGPHGLVVRPGSDEGETIIGGLVLESISRGERPAPHVRVVVRAGARRTTLVAPRWGGPDEAGAARP